MQGVSRVLFATLLLSIIEGPGGPRRALYPLGNVPGRYGEPDQSLKTVGPPEEPSD